VAAPAYLAAKGVPRIPDDLKASCLPAPPVSDQQKARAMAAAARACRIETELPRTAVASTIEPLISMAEQGVGIACLPDFAIGPATSRGVLVAVLDDYTDASGPFGSYAFEPASLSQTRVFVDFLAANLFPLWKAKQTE